MDGTSICTKLLWATTMEDTSIYLLATLTPISSCETAFFVQGYQPTNDVPTGSQKEAKFRGYKSCSHWP